MMAHLDHTDAPAKLRIEKGVITEGELRAKIAEERASSRKSSSRFDWTRKCPLISVRLLNDWNVLNVWNDWNQLTL